jgi:hypothetical protein
LEATSTPEIRTRMQFSPYLTSSEVGWKTPTAQEFRSRLSAFQRDSLIELCAYANVALFGSDPRWNWPVHDELVRRLIGPQFVGVRSLKSEDRVPVLHREGLLYLAKEATSIEPDGQLSAWNAGFQLFRLILSASDQLGFPPARRIPEQNNLALVANMVTAGEASRFGAWRHKLVRLPLILTNVIPDGDVNGKFDIPALFYAATGIPLPKYMAFVFAVLTKLMTNAVPTDRLPHLFNLDEKWFAETVADPELVELFFEDFSATPDELFAKVKSTNARASDFACFADRPLVKLGSRFIPVDLDFVAAKTESGVFWRILKSLPRERQNDFFAFWGLLYEKYANWLLSRRFRKGTDFLPDPRFADDQREQVADSLIWQNGNLVLIEFKGVLFNAESKYSGDPIALKSEIDRKLVGEPTNRKGLLQLANAIRQIFGPAGRKVAGISLSSNRKVFPVLVVRDDVVMTLCFNEYMNYRFKRD